MASSNLTSPASSIPGEILSTWLLKSWNNKTWVSQARIASGASCRSLTENINKKTERMVEATESEGKKGTIGPVKLLHCNIHSYRSALHESCCQWRPTVRFLPYPQGFVWLGIQGNGFIDQRKDEADDWQSLSTKLVRRTLPMTASYWLTTLRLLLHRIIKIKIHTAMELKLRPTTKK